jgi:hypothetical protein
VCVGCGQQTTVARTATTTAPPDTQVVKDVPDALLLGADVHGTVKSGDSGCNVDIGDDSMEDQTWRAVLSDAAPTRFCIAHLGRPNAVITSGIVDTPSVAGARRLFRDGWNQLAARFGTDVPLGKGTVPPTIPAPKELGAGAAAMAQLPGPNRGQAALIAVWQRGRRVGMVTISEFGHPSLDELRHLALLQDQRMSRLG